MPSVSEAQSDPQRPVAVRGPTAAASRGRDPLPRMAALIAAWMFGFGIYRAAFTNFAVRDVGLDAALMGALEGIRELPGLLTAALAAVAFALPAHRLVLPCLLAFAAGLGLFAAAGGFADLVAITLLFSCGFHLLMPVQDALVLGYARQGEKGLRLGQMGSVGEAAQLTAMAATFVLGGLLPVRGLFVLGAAVALLALLPALGLPPLPGERAAGPRLVFRRRYAPYYLITLLGGARRQVFLTFAAFSLVERQGLPVTTMALVIGAGSLLAVIGRPWFGALADRLGERRLSALGYLVVAGICLGFAFLDWLPVLCLLFALENFVRLDLLATTYLDRVAEPGDVRATLAAGGTVNHVAAVLIPPLGGLVWKALGAEATFVGGAAIAMASALACWLLLPERRDAPRAAAPATGTPLLQ